MMIDPPPLAIASGATCAAAVSAPTTLTAQAPQGTRWARQVRRVG
jgi:hypothetical protein